MIPCPERDWVSTSSDQPNDQIAALLEHYEQEHCGGQPQQLRDLLTACARALGGLKV